jgi:GTPase SAR1 family protein
MDKLLVLVTGLDGVGKSTLCGKIAYALYGVTVPLAQSLREELTELQPDVDYYEKPTPENVREAMIAFGASKRRLNENYFVGRWQQKVDALGKVGLLLCDDMRYPNEYAYFTEYFKVYHIHLKRQETEKELQDTSSYHHFQNSYFGVRADTEITTPKGEYLDDEATKLVIYSVAVNLIMPHL